MLCLVAGLLLTAQAMAATVYIEEFSDSIPIIRYQAAVEPAVTSQTVAITGSSVQSAAFNVGTHLIRVHADSTCSIKIGGTNPTATTSSMRFLAGQTEYFIVMPGDKLAVITNT